MIVCDLDRHPFHRRLYVAKGKADKPVGICGKENNVARGRKKRIRIDKKDEKEKKKKERSCEKWRTNPQQS